jgi:hypothetical protein
MHNLILNVLFMKYKILLMIAFPVIALLIPMNSVQALDYKFPWGKGHTWNWNQGWHVNAYNKAIDIGTSDANKFVLSSADGQVIGICDVSGTSVNVTIQHSDGIVLGYMHIEYGKLEQNIYVNAVVKQGQVLGQLKAGTWGGDSCGYAEQSPNFGHIHWTFPNGNGIVFEGWELKDYPTNQFINGSTIRVPGNNFSSSNTFTLRNGTLTQGREYKTAQEIVMLGDGNGLNIYNNGSGDIINRTI